MSEWNKPIARVRDAVCAVLKIKGSIDRSNIQPEDLKFVGTAWCIVPNRYFVTAFHTFNKKEPRQPDDKFLIFAIPGNGPQDYHTPVIGFPCERPDVDMAIMEIAPSGDFPNIPSINITFKRPEDGEKVLTYGFPAPEPNIIEKVRWKANGDWDEKSEIFLHGHANEGIVGGQYGTDPVVTYAFNIGWHHGDSGGPIIRLDSCAAFAIMQNYIDIKSPHGIVPGPHQGISLAAIEEELRTVGAIIV